MVTRKSLMLILGPLLAFGLLVIVAGTVNAGYVHSRDYVSSLASRGADQAWIGMLAFVSFAAAHAAAALRWRSARIVMVALLVCFAFMFIVGVARASCPDGAARCLLLDGATATDVVDTIHGLSVGIYALTFVLAAVFAGVVLLRRGHPGSGAVMLVLAVLSVLAVGQVDEQTPGAEQRIWFAVNALGLVALGMFGASGERDERLAPESS